MFAFICIWWKLAFTFEKPNQHFSVWLFGILFYAFAVIIPLGTLPTNVDSTSLPHSPLDPEGSPPPAVPPQNFSADDTLHSPKLPESSEPQQSERDATPPRPKMTNQEDAVPPRFPKTHQQTAVSVFALLGVLVCICHEWLSTKHHHKVLVKLLVVFRIFVWSSLGLFSPNC